MMVLWLVVGVAMGFILEAGGLGHPRKLTGVFLLKDFTVVKVLPAAMVAAMGGVAILTLFGMEGFMTPPTRYMGQAVGGLVFGLGFYLAGYCPGTSVVALGSGRLDALPFVGGMIGGYYVWEAIRPSVTGLLKNAPRNRDTWPEVLNIDAGLLTAVCVAALVAFVFLSERRRA